MPTLPSISASSRNSLLRSLIQKFAWTALVLGALVLGAWATGLEDYATVLPGWIKPRPNMALCLIFGGLALSQLGGLTEAAGASNVRRRVIAGGCALLVMLIGGASAYESFANVNLNIDELFFRDPGAAPPTYLAVRIPPVSSCDLFLLGSALFLLATTRARLLAQVLAGVVMFSALLVLTGTAYGMEMLYHKTQFTAVALLANAGFMLLAAGIFCATSDRGLMTQLTDPGTGGKVLRRMLPMAFAVPLVISWTSALLERAGYLSVDLGVSFFSIATILAFAGLIWSSSLFIRKGETETRQTEARLRETLNRYAFLADAMPEMVWTTKADGSADYFNLRWLQYTGLTVEESKSWGWKICLHPDDAQRCIDHWTESVRTGKSFESEYRLKGKDGSYRWFVGRAYPMRDEHGAIVQWVGSCSDIDDQKRARDELTQRVVQRTAEVTLARESLQAVLDSSTQVAIIAVDAKGTITLFNRGAENIYGYTAEEVVGRHNPSLFHVEWEVAARMREMSEKYGRPIHGFDALVENVRHGLPEEREWTMVRKDGTRFPARLIITAMRDGGSEITGFLGIVTDITPQKKANRQLHDQAVLLDLANDSIFIRDVNDLVTYWNQGAERLYGWSREEALGRVTHELLHTQFPQPLAQIRAEMLERGNWQGELTHTRSDGSIITVASSWTLQRDDLGEPISVIEINHDITARKRTEETLRASEKRFRLIVDSVEDYAIYMLNPAGYIVSWNSGAERIKGYRTDEIIGRHFSQFYTPEDLQAGKPARALEIARQTGRFTEEGMRVCKDGTRFLAELSIRAIYDDTGELRGFAKVTRNITERKKAEEEIRESRERLNTILNSSFDGIIVYESIRDAGGKLKDFRFSMLNPAAEKLTGRSASELIGRTMVEMFPATVSDGLVEIFIRIVEDDVPLDFEFCSSRTMPAKWYRVAGVKLGDGLVISYADITARKLYEKELQDAKVHAEMADRAKSNFLANMSHEIRTPMNGVIGLSSLLIETSLDTEQHSLAQSIRSSAESLLGVINDILDFSKIEAGKLSIEQIDFDLRKVVEDSLEVMASLAVKKGLELTGGIEPGTPTHLRGDPTRVQQVLTNLMGNALKFTSSGEVALRVRAEAETENNVLIRIEVRDTGMGMAPEVQSRLFQPFVQGDTSTSRQFGGTGLGLAISKRLAEAMNGSIGVTSKLGEGSTFWVTIDFARQGQLTPAEPAMPENFPDARVLVVDDNATSREFLRRQLDAWRLRNDSAASADEALELLRRAAAENAPYGLALVDLTMPGTDGLALAQRISNEPALQFTRVSLLTPIGKPVPSGDIAPPNVASSCTKPVRQSALLDCVMQGLATPVEPGVERTPAKRARTTTALPARRERILLAEDNAVNRQVALGNLRKLGYTADIAENGLEVLYAIETKPYDVILMDCQMPELDGYETTRQIRQRERGTHHTRIIAMTANAMVGDREKCLAAGMDDYVSKPLHRSDLRAALDRQMPKGKPPLAVKVLESLVEDDAEEMSHLAELFIATAPDSIMKMRVASDERNATQLAMAAHTLKGSCGSLGATTLREVCAQLEQDAREGRLDGADDLIASASEELQRFSHALAAYVQSKAAA